MEADIIDCGGKYEVHPGAKGGWCVVNSETGQVRSSFADKTEAVALAESLNAHKLTALEYANERENVVVRYASQGAPAGQDIAWIPPETELPFDLSQIQGEVGEDGGFTATNLNDGSGAHGWTFRDFRSNYVYALWLRVDEKVWQEQYAELMGEDA